MAYAIAKSYIFVCRLMYEALHTVPDDKIHSTF